jgi:pimeloyl-ACP methyl ester carboxylesterase
MAETMVGVNGVDLCVDTFGEAGAPPILLIAGASESMDGWDPELCRLLADDGRFVIRYDHRDTGRSTSWPPGRPGYSGSDLIADAAGLIDALAGGRAHVAGLSMGGGIAQRMAVEHPERVTTLTLIATSPGPGDDLPPIAERLRAALASPQPDPDWDDPEAVVESIVVGYRPFAGPGCFDQTAVRAAARRMVARTPNRGASAGNHWLLEGGGDARSRLGGVRAPALVVHGSEDPFFPPRHGEALAREIPDADLLLLDGVGHQAPPRSTWPVVVPAILRHTDHRVRFADVLESETRAHDERFRTAARVGPRDRVLDIGCGSGGSTRDAARMAGEGSVLGVDVSATALEEARRLSTAEGLCISRFGSMFFAHKEAAFTNIARALRPDARLVLLVWQSRERNESWGVVRLALGATVSSVDPAGRDAFSLGDQATAERILTSAGFAHVAFEDVHAPVCYGPDAATACEFALGFSDAREALASLDPVERDPARERLRAMLADHETERGVVLDGRTGIITARRR